MSFLCRYSSAWWPYPWKPGFFFWHWNCSSLKLGPVKMAPTDVPCPTHGPGRKEEAETLERGLCYSWLHLLWALPSSNFSHQPGPICSSLHTLPRHTPSPYGFVASHLFTPRASGEKCPSFPCSSPLPLTHCQSGSAVLVLPVLFGCCEVRLVNTRYWKVKVYLIRQCQQSQVG